jgi:hypothetical protein
MGWSEPDTIKAAQMQSLHASTEMLEHQLRKQLESMSGPLSSMEFNRMKNLLAESMPNPIGPSPDLMGMQGGNLLAMGGMPAVSGMQMGGMGGMGGMGSMGGMNQMYSMPQGPGCPMISSNFFHEGMPSSDDIHDGTKRGETETNSFLE